MSLFSATADQMVVTTGAITAAGATTLEVDQAASRVLTLKQWSIEFDGVTASNTPVRVQLGIVTAASAAGTVITPNAMRQNQAAVAAAAKKSPATEGTFVIIEEHRIPPTTGILIQYPLMEEPWIIGAASAASGVSIRAAASVAVNATATMEWEE
jgi:hypothetical protein